MNREQLIALLEPTVEGLGYELADLELETGLLRLFIDKSDAEEGVGLGDCAKVSSQVSAVLDVEDPIAGDYNLEVSSPGLSRRLVKAEHFERFAGNRVKVRLKRLFEGRRQFNKAKLVGIEDSNVLLQEGKEEFAVPLQEIDTARIVPKF